MRRYRHSYFQEYKLWRNSVFLWRAFSAVSVKARLKRDCMLVVVVIFQQVFCQDLHKLCLYICQPIKIKPLPLVMLWRCRSWDRRVVFTLITCKVSRLLILSSHCSCFLGDYEKGVDHLTNAIAVCGQPQQLLQVLQQTLPPPVFQMLLTKLPTISQVRNLSSSHLLLWHDTV